MENLQILFSFASTNHPVSSSMTNNSHVLCDFKADSTSRGFLESSRENYHLEPRTSSEINEVLNSQSASFGIGSQKELKAAKKKGEKKIRKPRYAFQTRSQVDKLDDGYRWRKYGQKAVKNNKFPRSYYRCTYQGCDVKKQVQRLTRDEGVVVTTIGGIVNGGLNINARVGITDALPPFSLNKTKGGKTQDLAILMVPSIGRTPPFPVTMTLSALVAPATLS
ncbi:hypothetical protein SADUNF_Sadunf17G0062100 [Salix dunnii]|uniref:WRKY domain-containing protein n=1 Tax=Salix dunnii TaxID=1413687 RepID=A0A835J5P8_9ROSI|nr:hypothetical protein SADUNF_Sadunf17G0062100 [Salix dunnii]